MTDVVVKPAGIGAENKYLLLLVLAIVLLSAAVILLDRTPLPEHQYEENQLDAGRDLNPVEQGIYADLKSAAEEIRWQLEAGTAPSIESLAADFIPPFVQDAVSDERGHHQWQLQQLPEQSLYWGLSGNAVQAGSFLLLIGDHDNQTAESSNPSSIWYHPGSAESIDSHTDKLSTSELHHQGWLQVVSHFNASVTRPGTH